MKNFSYVNHDCFVYDVEANALKSFSPISFEVNIDTLETVHHAIVGGIETNIVTDSETRFFDSEKDFVDGKEAQLPSWPISSLFRRAFGVDVKVGTCVENDVEKECYTAWAFENGEPKQISFTKGNFKCVLYPKEQSDCRHRYIKSYECLNFQGELYNDRMEALEMNEYTIIREDSIPQTVKGNGKKLKLSAYQEVVVDNFVRAVKSLENANVQLLYDLSDATFCVVNKEEVEKMYSFECDDDNRDVAVSVTKFIKKALDVNIFDYSEDLLIKFKD